MDIDNKLLIKNLNLCIKYHKLYKMLDYILIKKITLFPIVIILLLKNTLKKIVLNHNLSIKKIFNY
jgi:hypothetical protein